MVFLFKRSYKGWITVGRNIVVALDMGTSTIKAALAEVYNEGEINILGITAQSSLGLRKGNIIDIESTARAMEDCLNDLERLTGLEIESALIGFSGGSISTLNNHAAVAVRDPSYEITVDDRSRVLQAARNIALSPDKSIVQTVERQYIIDGYDGVKDPVGMVGGRLEAEVAIIIAATAAVQNLQRTARRINLDLHHLVFNPLLVAESVLLPAEKEMGVALVDIGGGIISISNFEAGSLLCSSVLPVGGEYITKDLAIVLKTTIEEAAGIKERYGTATAELANEELLIEIRNIQGKEVKKISQQVVAEIISARVIEIAEMIRFELSHFGCLERLPGGVVLTGGGAELPGMVGAMETYLNLPARLGLPENIKGIPADFNRPRNAAVLGGLIYAAGKLDINYEVKHGLSSVFDRMGSWLKDFFR